ncbi:hypothetical protein [Flavobacterium lacus]|uniref:Outer membrane protein with beta-barrel domain n=1 Tax=Flavobacterium lacus TaxID=1353778 RepID=A0A328WQV5_9FLAO|nr:hypothetical protein [Flavobacterium lacus]RAR47655.1 hypothetical protein B0I10_108158 [Flavobacterium lacus]
MKKITLLTALFLLHLTAFAQERVVRIDFESGSFLNNPQIPYDEPFSIVGEAGNEIEFVKVNIAYEGKKYSLHSYEWNRIEKNDSEKFNIVVPAVLRSNTKYDFEIITYTLLSQAQKQELLQNVENRVRFLLESNLYYDGKNVQVNKPKKVYEQLQQLVKQSLYYHESKNLIPVQAPSSLVLQELNNQGDFKFSRFFKKGTRVEKDEIANGLITEKIDHLVGLVLSELAPFINSEVVQHYRKVTVKSVKTDREPFSLPVNFGMYAWDKSVNVNETSVNNVDFTPGVGLTIPFSSRSRLASQSRLLDSFGFSAGILLKPVVDNLGNEFVTPGVNLPVYAGLGFRIFKVVRLNAGVLILGEKGNQDFDKITLIPTVGLAFELNVWMGIKN